MGLEIERKFLIKYPDVASLSGEVWEIEQTYLHAPRGETRRVRRIVCGGGTKYVFTEKRHVTDVTRIENERELGRAEYETLLAERDEDLRTIEKMRVRVPDGSHVWEVDLYPFWNDRAILEIELEGARHVKEKYPDAVLVILLPVTFKMQEERLRKSATPWPCPSKIFWDWSATPWRGWWKFPA